MTIRQFPAFVTHKPTETEETGFNVMPDLKFCSLFTLLQVSGTDGCMEW